VLHPISQLEAGGLGGNAARDAGHEATIAEHALGHPGKVAALDDGERGWRLAEMIMAVKYDLPLTPEEGRKLHAGLTESEPVKPSQTKSKTDKAGPKEDGGVLTWNPFRTPPTAATAIENG
jgi:hypothetical protein